MAHFQHLRRCRALLGSIFWLACFGAAAQTQTVVVQGRAGSEPAALSGFDDAPAARSPFAAASIGTGQLQDAGIAGLSGITKLDAATGDAYNAEGYWSLFSMRGFVIDPRANYRRDGLPINAETSIALENKQAVELLKGTSGMQAGVSAPGGLINLVVKRPSGTRRDIELSWAQPGSLKLHADLGGESGDHAARFGWRVNATAQRLDPALRDARGQRSLLAVATDWRTPGLGLLELEFETSHQSQPSQPGFSLLGNQVPDARRIDPRINLNNQAWSQPVVLDGDTASLRWSRPLGDTWRVQLHLGSQRLHSDDRVAFPFGVFDPITFACSPCDRFAADGSFTLWQFVSDNERRRTDAVDLSLRGKQRIAGMDHALQFGALRSRFRARFGDQIFDIAGTGIIDGSAVVPPSAGFTSPNTNRDEDATELYWRDHISLSQATSAWIGLRHTRLSRASVGTDGSAPVAYQQSFTSPWLALSQQLGDQFFAYVSWGQGAESDVVPNQPRYANAGQPLPAIRSRQIEAGLKFEAGAQRWSLAAFDIRQPKWSDFGTCDVAASCTRARDGIEQHRGMEGALGWTLGPWNLAASAMILDAQRRNTVDPANEGLQPTNVPKQTLRLQAQYELASMPGVSLGAGITHEGARATLPDNSILVPAWTRIDLGARYATTLSGRAITWRAGLDNAADTRAWRESPYQFGHSYLYPLAPRTLWLSMTLAL